MSRPEIAQLVIQFDDRDIDSRDIMNAFQADAPALPECNKRYATFANFWYQQLIAVYVREYTPYNKGAVLRVVYHDNYGDVQSYDIDAHHEYGFVFTVMGAQQSGSSVSNEIFSHGEKIELFNLNDEDFIQALRELSVATANVHQAEIRMDIEQGEFAYLNDKPRDEDYYDKRIAQCEEMAKLLKIKKAAVAAVKAKLS